MIDPIVKTSPNLSLAWAEAFTRVMEPSHTPSLIVQIDASERGIMENEGIRSRLADSLSREGKSSIDTVANTIFPYSLWNPSRPRQELYDRYRAIWPKIKKCHGNSNGVYFQRLIAFPDFGTGEVNQLEYVIRTCIGGNRRHSAHQASIYAPGRDATNQRQRGFPCLQQVAFSIEDGALMVIGFYPTQYVFEKAYGNYLGLCRLGVFMAHELGIRFAGMQCFASHPKLGDVRKGDLQSLASDVRYLISNCATEDA